MLQIEMRSISMEKLHLIIAELDELIEESDNQVIHQKIVDGYMYRVSISKSTEPAVIKMAYKTSKSNKYRSDES